MYCSQRCIFQLSSGEPNTCLLCSWVIRKRHWCIWVFMERASLTALRDFWHWHFMPQLTWERKKGLPKICESNNFRWTWLYTVFNSVGKILPMLAMMAMFERSGAVFSMLWCLILGDSDQSIPLPMCVFTWDLLTSAIPWGCSQWWMHNALFI